MENRVNFERLFKTDSEDRDKFLSRLLGIFSEEIVRIWSEDSRSPYNDLGRPTIYEDGVKRGSTIDFCFNDVSTGKKYISEMKCEIQYENYKYLTLESHTQLSHHAKPNKKAFLRFLDVTKNPIKHKVTFGKEPNKKQIAVDGGILVWGRVSPEGKKSVMEHYGFADVLSLESIINDLSKWSNPKYKVKITKLKSWCDYLFKGFIVK